MFNKRPIFLLVPLLLVSLKLAAEEREQSRLAWKNGDNLSGSILEADGKTLTWQSRMFAEPLRLELDRLRSVQVGGTADSNAAWSPKGSVRIIMRNRDVLYGDLVGVSGEEIEVNSDRHGTVKLLRGHVRSLRRLSNESLVYLGPNGLQGWGVLSKTRKLGEWSAKPEGSLETSRQRSELFREIEIPKQAEIEIVLESSSRPAFLIAMDDRPGHSMRLETWDDELVALSGDDFEPILTIGKDVRTLHLRLYWNQPQNEMTVYSREGKKLGSIAGKDSNQSKPGFYLRNKAGNLVLKQVRINRWNGITPKEVKPGEGRVHLVDGDIAYGEIKGFEGGKLILSESSEPNSIDFEQVDSIYLADDADEKVDFNSVQIVYGDGGLLQGTLLSIKEDSITLQLPYSAQPVQSSLKEARQVIFARTKDLTPPALDKMYTEGGVLRGTLEGGSTPSNAICWRATGGLNASPLSKEISARFVRGAVAQPSTYDQNLYRDLLFLANDDIVPCQIKAVDEEFVLVKTAFAEAEKIENRYLRAVEFGPSGASLFGFDDAGWQIIESDKTLKVSGDEAIFSGSASFGHASILQGKGVHFSLRWDPESVSVLNLRLFQQGLHATRSPISLTLTCSGTRVSIGEINNVKRLGGLFRGRGRTQVVGTTESKAAVDIEILEQLVQLKVNGSSVYRQPLKQTERIGVGLVFDVRSSAAGKPEKELLTISDFHSIRGDVGNVRRYVDEETKRQTLTVPRFRKKDPPTHILIAPNGDLLRGRLTKIAGDSVYFESRLREFVFDRARVAAIVWLHKEPVALETAGTVQAVLKGGLAVAVSPQQMSDKKLVGVSNLLGKCDVPLKSVQELYVGYDREDSLLAYADWKPAAAREPQFEQGEDGTGPAGPPNPLVGKPAADFQTTLLDGGKFQLSEQRGKIVVLDFWATWCGPCVRAMPAYLSALSAFDSEKVIFVGVNQAENPETVRDFVLSREWELIVAMDTNQAIARQFGVSGIPHTVVIGPDGTVEWVHVGFRPGVDEELKSVVLRLTGADQESAGSADAASEK